MSVTIQMKAVPGATETSTPASVSFEPSGSITVNKLEGVVFQPDQSLESFVTSPNFHVGLCIDETIVEINQMSSITEHFITANTHKTIFFVLEKTASTPPFNAVATQIKQGILKGYGDDPTHTTGEIIVR